MAKKRERNETEYLRGLVRELKAEVRNLKKQAGRHNKKLRGYEQLVSEDEPEANSDIQDLFKLGKPRCPDCQSDDMEIVDLGIRELSVCYGCGYRKAIPKPKKK